MLEELQNLDFENFIPIFMRFSESSLYKLYKMSNVKKHIGYIVVRRYRKPILDLDPHKVKLKLRVMIENN